jgi:hypothetical protein
LANAFNFFNATFRLTGAKTQVLPEGVAAGECGMPLDEASSQA